MNSGDWREIYLNQYVQQVSAVDPESAALSSVSRRVGAYVGYRAWRVTRLGRLGPWTNMGLSVGNVWQYPGEVLAYCDADYRPVEHGPIPDPRCKCGIYAVPHPVAIELGCEGVAGRVDLYGYVQRHKRGWRASHARVTGIFLEAATADREYKLEGYYRAEHRQRATEVAEIYDVPLLGWEEHEVREIAS